MIYAYSSAAQFDNRDLTGSERLPFSMWLVSSLKVDDGLNLQSTTVFDYKGGMYYRPACEFRGFREITRTDPMGAYTVTTLRQDDYVWGKIASTIRYDALNTLVVGTEKFYGVVVPNSNSPGIQFPKLEQTIRAVYDGQTTPIATMEQYKHDIYGNVIETTKFNLSFD